jgi:hypothetical protein
MVDMSELCWLIGLVKHVIQATSFHLLFVYLLATDPEVRVRFPAIPYVLRSSESGTGSTQPREYN